MLRVAVPNKGSLSEPASRMLREAGYRQRTQARELVLHDPENDTEFFFLRPRDIATYVGSGQLDVGITGRDLLLDSGTDAHEIMPLGFGASTFRFAALPGTASTTAEIEGLRVATSYPGLVAAHLADRDVTATVIRLDGAVETSVRLGVADVIADVVETGSTLRQAGLELFGEPILQSEAVLIRGNGGVANAELDASIDQLERRLNGVMVAATYVIVDYDVPAALVERACEITPGIESPTISPLHDPEWVAVRALVPRPDTNNVMDDLYDLGARGILVTDIHACRL
ncbi:MAG TPA: ATP phosphoribosyltransferase [Actinomycetes bacterium]|nr:ATP phosphoribosyltransferase [Actinomycetes bacterium]